MYEADNRIELLRRWIAITSVSTSPIGLVRRIYDSNIHALASGCFQDSWATVTRILQISRLVIIWAVFLVTYHNVLRNLEFTTLTITGFNPLQLNKGHLLERDTGIEPVF